MVEVDIFSSGHGTQVEDIDGDEGDDDDEGMSVTMENRI